MPSLFVFLGVAVLIVAFLGISSAKVAETCDQLRGLLADAGSARERSHRDRQKLAARLRSLEQAYEPLLHERVRLGEAAAELTGLAQRIAQGDQSAARALQSVRPGAYGPLADLTTALARWSRVPAGSWSQPIAVFGTHLADIRNSQENVEAVLPQRAAGSKTPPILRDEPRS